MLDDGDFARQAIERRFIELAFAVGLLGLRFRTIEIAHHFGDRDDVAGIDLGFVFLRPARPHRALDARAALEGLQRPLDQRRLGQLAHADIGDLGGRHAQRHLVLHEIDHEQLKLGARDLLLLDGQDLADAVRGIDHEFVGLEALTLGQDLLRLLHARSGSHRLGGRLRRHAATALGATAFGGSGALQGSWQRPSKQWPSSPSLSRQFWQSFLALRFFCFSRTLWPQPSWRSFTDALARPLVALRLAAAAFFVVLETLFLRVFCDTACARNCHAPVRCFYGNPPGPKIRMAGFGLLMCPI